jgi:hypothetical protein
LIEAFENLLHSWTDEDLIEMINLCVSILETRAIRLRTIVEKFEQRRVEIIGNK